MKCLGLSPSTGGNLEFQICLAVDPINENNEVLHSQKSWVSFKFGNETIAFKCRIEVMTTDFKASYATIKQLV